MEPNVRIDRVDNRLAGVDSHEMDFDAALHQRVSGGDRDALGASRTQMSDNHGKLTF
jgi:hypothetical protein